MTRVTRGTTSSLQRGKREKEEREAMPSMLTNDHDVQKLIARHVTDEQLASMQERLAGTTFEVNGVRYQIVQVYRDDLQRVIAVGTKAEAVPV